MFVLAVLLGGASPLIYLVLWVVMPEEQAAASVAPRTALPDHPRPVEQWNYDPYTGEKIK